MVGVIFRYQHQRVRVRGGVGSGGQVSRCWQANGKALLVKIMLGMTTGFSVMLLFCMGKEKYREKVIFCTVALPALNNTPPSFHFFIRSHFAKKPENMGRMFLAGKVKKSICMFFIISL